VDVRAARVAALPAAPGDAAWDRVPAHSAELRVQDLVEPRKMKPGIAKVRVQALGDGRSVAFRLAWADPTADVVRLPASFGDACAVQLPAAVSADLPAPQMGEKGRKVEIAWWSAAAQSRPDDLKALYPNAHVDHYPFDAAQDPAARESMAALYSPGRALDRFGRKAVQDLVAEGPGTLVPAAAQVSEGKGTRSADGWAVVIVRPAPKAARTHVSFAVWNGSEQDAGSRKMWTPWIPLVLEEK
jgi:hypothetical protein